MKIGVIGLGDIAQKAYLPVLTQKEGVELVFCTRNTTVLSRLTRQYRIKESCTDYKSLIALKVDAVMIHAATAIHPDIAGFFLKQGIPTFVDKPLASSAVECEKLYDVAEQHNQPLYVGFNRRHIPLYNQHLPDVQSGNNEELLAFRWEKNRYNQPGQIRDFIFDDFIHPLDSINLNAKSELSDAYVTYQKSEGLLARVDIQWQHNETLLHASMDRQHGATNEIVSANFAGKSFKFESFLQGYQWQNSQQTTLMLKDWTPMLASKGFFAMIDDWVKVVEKGKLDSNIITRNIASHQLAESLCQRVSC